MEMNKLKQLVKTLSDKETARKIKLEAWEKEERGRNKKEKALLIESIKEIILKFKEAGFKLSLQTNDTYKLSINDDLFEIFLVIEDYRPSLDIIYTSRRQIVDSYIIEFNDEGTKFNIVKSEVNRSNSYTDYNYNFSFLIRSKADYVKFNVNPTELFENLDLSEFEKLLK